MLAQRLVDKLKAQSSRSLVLLNGPQWYHAASLILASLIIGRFAKKGIFAMLSGGGDAAACSKLKTICAVFSLKD